ncbi:MAG: DUF3179 domain-containing protein [Acidimicrobiia bacterium]
MNRFGMVTAFASAALIVAACGASPDNETVGEDPDPTTVATNATTLAGSEGMPAGPSALTDRDADAFPDPLVPVDEIISGGPPPDGIPPLDTPVFGDVADSIDQLEPAEAVVALEIDGDARAYPVRVLIWHEIVNDTVGGSPVSVTYCPLCNSAVSYLRVVRGVETTFGTSGSLYASALVMYDRLTESLWTHFDGQAIVGVLAGDRLEPIASPLMSWEEFVEAYPTGKVLDWTQTGFERDYGRNPYEGYDNPDTDPFLFRGVVDDRERAKQRVVGISIDGASVAYSMEEVASGERSVTMTTVGDRDLVILWQSGQSSALDDSQIGGGDDVGSVGVFVPVVNDAPVTLTVAGDEFVDEETGSTWNVAGIATKGPLAGSRLDRVQHLDTFWFAWSTYRPGTTLIGG